MTSSTFLPGVDRHRDRYRVRKMFPAPYDRWTEYHETLAEANAAAIELDRRRKDNLPPRDATRDDSNLTELVDALMTKKNTWVSRKTGKKLRQGTLDWWARITNPWKEGELGELPVSHLRLAKVEEEIAKVSAYAVPEANNRLVGIKAILRLAQAGGMSIDQTILALETIPHTPRIRQALSAEELLFLAEHAPVYARKTLLFKGQVGMRWKEVVTLQDRRFNFEERTVFVPAGLCKEATDKIIDLSDAEAILVREQQLARAPGAKTIFCTKTGVSWAHNYGQFHKLVWAKAVTRADAAWRKEYDLDESADTPFIWAIYDESDEPLLDEEGEPMYDRLEPHDLRATAITLMRDAGFTKEQTACRVGHADSGELIERIYDRGDRRVRAGVQEAVKALPKGGLLGVAEAGRKRSSSPAATVTSASSEGR